MAYACRIETDSINESGDRLTTFVVTYPRFVHSELMTHRVFSRNSSSSRAIPTEKLIEQVMTDPAGPVWWGKNQKGMQAREELTGIVRINAETRWLAARDQVVEMVQGLHSIGLHKQIANRLLEPWMWITVIISATEYENFFALRCHPDAQPEIRKIAEMMQVEYRAAVPAERGPGEWHLPFVVGGEGFERNDLRNRKLSVARCARVSYLTHDGKYDVEADLALHDRLAESGHWSPFEHVAESMGASGKYYDVDWQSGNFTGWRQYRKQFANENRGKRE